MEKNYNPIKKDELTTAMHSEFKIDAETEIKHRAGCVWCLLDGNASRKDIEKWSSKYGVTYEQCMQWKDYYDNLKMQTYIAKSKKKQNKV